MGKVAKNRIEEVKSYKCRVCKTKWKEMDRFEKLIWKDAWEVKETLSENCKSFLKTS